ncbi:unnamed protein product [Gongylonema pulchrum]|uniref:Exostosin domain-containing protein n=1 Tax=Gongylonema pulchrum TaxID=637853 RepID=A0A183D0Z0_9BILA|nr:unnamed protein product [Gongylonema pulchrum]
MLGLLFCARFLRFVVSSRTARYIFDDYAKELTVQHIREKHSIVCSDQKKFRRAVLAYVTPWNSGGYDIAKWAAAKFTYISPVWFQFKPEIKQQRKMCTIFGAHDLDKGWLADIKLNNSEIRFVPRFIVDVSDRDSLDQFIYDIQWQKNCGQRFIKFIKVVFLCE